MKKADVNTMYTKEEKIGIVREYLMSDTSLGELSRNYNIPKNTILSWVTKFRAFVKTENA